MSAPRVEQEYYENPEIWAAEAYLDNEDESRRFRRCAALIPAEAKTLLDVGTGNGAFLHVLESVRPAICATGLERSRVAIERAVCRAPITEGSSDSLPFESRSFDVVTAFEVIEHLPYGVFGRSLAEIARVARSHIVVSVPYCENRLWVECPYCGCSFNPFYHLHRFDESVMERLIGGFVCTSLERIVVQDIVFSRVARSSWRWLRARRGFSPRRAMCPQCGYSERPCSGPGSSTSAKSVGQKETVERLAALLPRRERPKWIVGVYQRVAGGAS